MAARAGGYCKTSRRYVEAAQAASLAREPGVEGPNDELIGVVVSAVRRAHPNGHDASWETLLGHEEQIRAWLGAPEKLSMVKAHELLAQQGEGRPYRTVHRFAGRALRLRGVPDLTV